MQPATMTANSHRTAQIIRFALVSGVSFTIDAVIYGLLSSETIDLDASWAKRISFGCIAVWGYFAHKVFTFRHRGFIPGEPLRFAMLFIAGWMLNSAVHDLTATRGEAGTFAFVAATAAWACFNYVGQRVFVFRESGDAHSSGA